MPPLRPRPDPDPAPSGPPVPYYPPREDTALLAPFAGSVRRGDRVVDVGTGNGALALAAARAGGHVVATDVNPFALHRLSAIARSEGVRLEAVRADLLRGLRRFDRILANPPYLPTRPSQRDPDRWQNAALDGGPDGCRVTARLWGQLARHLAPRGVAFLLVSSLQSPGRLRRLRGQWTARGGSVTRVARRTLAGETLEVWAIRSGAVGRTTRGVRRTGRPPTGIGARRRARAGPRSGSNRAPARGRTTARDAASVRRRSPRGS